jgi:SAM-dependent methyltransferase
MEPAKGTGAMSPQEIKQVIKEKYTRVVVPSKDEAGSCCCGTGSSCCSPELSTFSENYDHLEGYVPEADFGLGCGIPTMFADIKKGDYVLDLGSGAGNDCFIAAGIVGESGLATGLDFTDAMVEKARSNANKRGFINVEFVKGDIEDMPLPTAYYDVVISNCVLNLVPDKERAFAQIKRVLKPTGHFCVSDVVTKGELPAELREDAEMYAGCVSGAVRKEEYLEIIKKQGFKNITVCKENEIVLPQEVIDKYYTVTEQQDKSSERGIFSITVTASANVSY